MELRKYERVIARMIAANAGRSPEEVAAAVIQGVEFAQMLMDDIAPAVTNPPNETVRRHLKAFEREPSAFPPPDPNAKMFVGVDRASCPDQTVISLIEKQAGGKAILLAEAPPSPMLEGGKAAEEVVIYHTVEELAALVSGNMPTGMTLQLPGFDKPLELKRRISQPPFGGEGWGAQPVRVIYAQPGEEMGPTVQVLTSTDKPDWKALKESIIGQAESLYRKEKVKISPKVPPPVVLTEADLLKASSVPHDTTDNQFTPEDRADAQTMHAAIETGMRQRNISGLDDWKPAR